MTDPRNDPGTSSPGGWQPGYQPAAPPSPAPQSPAPQSGPYQGAPPTGGPQPAWQGWQGPPANQAYPQAAAGPGRPAGDSGPTKQQSAGRTQLALGAGIGFVVALAVVGVLLLTHVLSVGSNSDSATAVDTRPITMPDTLGGLKTTVAVTTAKAGADRGKSFEERNGRTIDLTVKSYQQAYGGAAVGVQMYANDDLLFLGTAIAVRAKAPGLTTGPVPDPADLKLAQNQQDVVTVGDAQCLVYHTATTPEGQTPDPADDRTGLCQRTGPDGTAFVYGNAGGDNGTTQADMVKMADELYAQLGTG
jgi:hypothetical protein